MLSQKANAVIDEMSELAAPIVQLVESGTPTTQHRYGEYMSAIQQIATLMERRGQPMKPMHYLGIGLAMIRAGGNRAGIISALTAMGHLGQRP